MYLGYIQALIFFFLMFTCCFCGAKLIKFLCIRFIRVFSPNRRFMLARGSVADQPDNAAPNQIEIPENFMHNPEQLVADLISNM